MQNEITKEGVDHAADVLKRLIATNLATTEEIKTAFSDLYNPELQEPPQERDPAHIAAETERLLTQTHVCKHLHRGCVELSIMVARTYRDLGVPFAQIKPTMDELTERSETLRVAIKYILETTENSADQIRA